MVVNIIKIFQKIKRKGLLSIAKDILRYLLDLWRTIILKNNDLRSFDAEYKDVLKL